MQDARNNPQIIILSESMDRIKKDEWKLYQELTTPGTFSPNQLAEIRARLDSEYTIAENLMTNLFGT